MSWRDQLQAASFRGVAFHVVRTTDSFGRRTVLHEYPFRDKPYVEDMGRAARRVRVQAIVIGDDYMAERDRLIEAIEQEGPGKLVHPYLGELTVSITEDGLSIDQSSSEGGCCQISFSCVESGEARFPAGQIATQDVVKQRATAAQTALQSAYKGRFSLAGLPSWAQSSAIDRARGFLGAALTVIGPLANASGARGALQAIVDRLLPGIAGVVSNVVGFATDVLAMTRAIREGMAPRDASRALASLASFGAADGAVIANTSIRRQEAANRIAMIELFRGAAAIERALATADQEFTDYQDAVTVRDSVLEQLDAVAEITTDDVLFNTLSALRAAVVSDINARGADLARVVTVSPSATLPALVLAYDLYEDASLEADIVARNRVVHPGYLLAGKSLEILADG